MSPETTPQQKIDLCRMLLRPPGTLYLSKHQINSASLGRFYRCCRSVLFIYATERNDTYVPWVVFWWMRRPIHHEQKKHVDEENKAGKKEQWNSRTVKTYTHWVKLSCNSNSTNVPLSVVTTFLNWYILYALKTNEFDFYDTSDSFPNFYISQCLQWLLHSPRPSFIHSFIHFHTVAFPGGRYCCDWAHNWASGAWGREEI